MFLYDFYGNEEDGEFVFVVGEIIYVIEKINNDWLRGEYFRKIGIFLCGFVDISIEFIDKLFWCELSEIVFNSSEGELNGLEFGLYCKVLFDFISDVFGDFSFYVGDIIKIKKKVS